MRARGWLTAVALCERLHPGVILTYLRAFGCNTCEATAFTEKNTGVILRMRLVILLVILVVLPAMLVILLVILVLQILRYI